MSHTNTGGARSFTSAFAFAACLLITSTLPASAQATIHAGDKLQVTVFNHADLSAQVAVAGDGSIALPVAGDVSVEGFDADAAAVKITIALKPYLRYPAVNVRILQQGGSVFFTGSQIGVQPYQPGETLGAALGAFMSQKPADVVALSSIDLHNVRLERDGKPIGTYDLEALTRNRSPGPRLQPNDTVLVANKPIRVTIRGDIKNPGPVYLYPGDTLSQAISQAGDIPPTASLAKIVLLRDGTERVVSSASETFKSPAQDGDILTLQPAPRVNVVGMVTTPGQIVLTTDATLLSALYLAGGPTKFANLTSVTINRVGESKTYNVSGLIHGDLHGNVPLQDGDVVFVPEGHKMDGTALATALGTLRYVFFP
jgi:polysaccharide export outer membrane protein